MLLGTFQIDKKKVLTNTNQKQTHDKTDPLYLRTLPSSSTDKASSSLHIETTLSMAVWQLGAHWFPMLQPENVVSSNSVKAFRHSSKYGSDGGEGSSIGVVDASSACAS